MKNRTIAVITAVVMAVLMMPAAAFAGDEAPQDMAVQEVPDEIAADEEAMEEIQEVVEDAAENPEEETEISQSDQIAGLYMVNYVQAEGKVNLNLVFLSDLAAVSQQADTRIYDFREDNTVVIYDKGTRQEGTWQADDTQLTVSADGKEHQYTYEFVDGLLILHENEDSEALFHFSADTGVELEDYSVIEIDEAAVEIPDAYVDSFIDSLLQGQTKTEVITEGETKDGDLVTISFAGTLEGEDHPFEGGSGEHYTLQLGTGTLIDNYEEQLMGQKIGSTFDVTVTFPEDYSGAEELRGKKATFSTTIESVTNVMTPELTDEWVKEYTREYFPEPLNTVDEFREYCRKYLETNALHTAIFQVMAGKLQDTEYHNTAMAQMLLNYANIHLSAAAESYGMDAETFAQQMGYSSADSYVKYEASSNIMSALIIDKVMQDLGIIYTNDDLNAQLADEVKLSYGSTMTPEDYRTQSGTLGMWAFTNLQYKYNLITGALEDRVVLIPHTEEETAADEAGQGE